MYSFKYNQQDATLYNILYYCQCSTCFGRKQRYTIFFITINALHISGGFSAHHQEPKNCTHSIGYVPGLLAAAVSMGELLHAFINSVLNGISQLEVSAAFALTK